MPSAPPAIEQVMDELVKKLAAIVPTVDPATRFRRSSETTEADAARRRRSFDIEFRGTRDLSSDGEGVLNVGVADHETRLAIEIGYPFVGGGERALERQLASDTAHLLRALNRGAWAGTTVRRAKASITVGDDEAAKLLLVDLVVLYRDTM